MGKSGNKENDFGDAVSRIKELVEAMVCNKNFKLITKHKNETFSFNSNPLRHLMKYCDNEAHRVLSTISSRVSTTNVLNFAKKSIIINDSVME